MKIIVAAKEDATFFLATNGQVRTARFEQALQVLRSITLESTASDDQLALAIIDL